ncbi:class I lanthipeptide [Chryseobacterium daecheongense]|uniref:Bacteriocin n=1 Tax=Chryseobacterium daecheongense TaxID=192389 RepID=A0ABY2FZZ1_9FLAO|nr:class I lanthipeptide [Chryseobacterium daecheongense]TDX95023.1 hypothetical protein BCF50_0796 [Chryseobacterium daecheongense]UOU97238.1 class I lanthipeptide [Chryseobacterium daecheongense]
MKTKKFSALQINKKAVANLNDVQLNAVKGGKGAVAGCSNGGITCETPGSTVIIKTRVS